MTFSEKYEKITTIDNMVNEFISHKIMLQIQMKKMSNPIHKERFEIAINYISKNIDELIEERELLKKDIDSKLNQRSR